MIKLIFKLKQGFKVLLSDKIADVLIVAVYSFIMFRLVADSADVLSKFETAAQHPVGITLEYPLLYFLLFLFISFELFSRIKRENIDELMEATTGYKGYFTLFFAVMVLNLFLFMGLTAVNIFFTTRFTNWSGAFLWHITRVLFLYYFLVGVLAAAAGMALAKIKNRLVGLGALIFTALLVSQMIRDVVPVDVEGIRRFYELFAFLPDLRYGMMPFAGYSISLDEWVHLLMLTAACAVFVWNGYGKRYQKWVTGTLVGVTAVLVYFYAQPHSGWGDEDSRTPDYYSWENSNELVNDEKEADFNIQSYEIDLKIRTKLTAKCEMQISKQDLSEYYFTLDQNLKISKVEDQDGKAREYEQDGNYVTVYAKDGGNIQRLTFYYTGLSGEYVDTEAVYLPGDTMPFYPRAGHLKIVGAHTVYIDSGRPHFTLRIDSKINVYTNLDREDKNRYAGNAENIILYGGFVKELQIGDIWFYYPYLSVMQDFSEETILKQIGEIDQAIKESGSDFTIHGKKVFIMDILNSTGSRIYDNYMNIGGLAGMALSIKNNRIGE